MTYEINFADAETPVAAQTQLILQHAPLPASSLQFFRNGLLQSNGRDYVLSGNFIVPNPAPDAQDVFVAWYRY